MMGVYGKRCLRQPHGCKGHVSFEVSRLGGFNKDRSLTATAVFGNAVVQPASILQLPVRRGEGHQGDEGLVG